MLITLKLPPGLYANGTEYMAKGRFYSANLVRWYEGVMQPIGGWQERSDVPVEGVPRALIAWLDNSASVWVGIGTNEGLFIQDRGATVYDITPTGFTPGEADATTGGGYGDGLYGDGYYGTPRIDTEETLPASSWSLDTWGEDLVGVMDSDGHIYEWSLVTATPAIQVANSPPCSAVLVSDSRHMMALGANGNPRLVAWSDRENNTDWTPTALSQAGDIQLQTQGQIMCGKRVKGTNLIFTDGDVHSMEFIGMPFIFNTQRIGSGCGVASRQAVAVVDSQAYWIGDNSFWRYNGIVRPMPSDVGDYVFSNMNVSQKSKISAYVNSRYKEISWLYPSADSLECDSYVSLNIESETWTFGKLNRTCGADESPLANPIMASPEGLVYEHETGVNHDGVRPFALCGPLEIDANGQRTMMVRQIIPDERSVGDVEVSFRTRFYPNLTDDVFGPYTMSSPSDCRFTARQVSPEFIFNGLVSSRVGDFRFDVVPGSER